MRSISRSTAAAGLVLSGVLATPAVAPAAAATLDIPTASPQIELTSGFFDSITNAFQVATFLGDPANQALIQPAALFTLDGSHGFLWSALNGFAIPEISFPAADPSFDSLGMNLINFAASPLSGVLLGTAGPFLSPVVELFNSLQTVFDDLGDGDVGQLFQDLLATPVNVVESIFNGTTLDLTWAIPLLDGTGIFDLANGSGSLFGDVDSLTMALGGILTQGVTLGDTTDLTVNMGDGGSILNALSFEFFGQELQGQATGLFGAWENFFDLVSGALFN